jgi:hypothetical protein
MKKTILISALLSTILMQGCSENFSNGERIGVVTQFSRTGLLFKSYEGHLNVTQTGMNSSVPFDFSIDNDNEPENLVKTIDSAARFGWKVKLIYHQTLNKNWFNNRGETNHFIEKCEVLGKNFGGMFNKTEIQSQGKVLDTIYVVINKSK